MENNVYEKLTGINENKTINGLKKNRRFEVWQIPPNKKEIKLYTVTR